MSIQEVSAERVALIFFMKSLELKIKETKNLNVYVALREVHQELQVILDATKEMYE